MECYYHPERESTDVCAICGKSVCKECGLEIAGKIYCKDCLEKIVGVGLQSAAPESNQAASAPMKSEPARLNKQPGDDAIYQPQEEVEPITPQHAMPQEGPAAANKGISEDSPYNIKDNIEYTGGLESSYPNEPIQQNPIQPQVAQNGFEQQKAEIPQQPIQQEDDGFIYPDHSYEPEPIAGQNLEDKYERYLDDLYFDENEIPLNEQLAKDEEEFGSLTKKPYKPKEAEAPAPRDKKLRNRGKNDEVEDKIRAEIEKELHDDGKPIHNLNYQQEKEPIGVVDVILTLILVIIILIVLYYLIYLFFLSTNYPTFLDAVFALSNPQNVINNILK